MNQIIEIVEDRKTSEFYPTPEKLVKRMLEKLDWKRIKTVLEPSAGKGDILKGVARKETSYRYFDVDAIELDANLRSILRYNFSQEAEDAVTERKNSLLKPFGYTEYDHIEEKYTYVSKDYIRLDVPESVQEQVKDVDYALEGFFHNGIHVVHDDFLTYTSHKMYDAVIMNPSFSDGDRHLLKALEMQKNGGQIVCLLNAETIRNPYTPTRMHLVEQLNKLDADIEYIETAFIEAERPTAVEVALIYVSIPHSDDDGVESIYDRLVKAKQYSEPDFEGCTELTIGDYIKAAVNRYKIEVEAGVELIKTYKRMKPHLDASLDAKEYKSPILCLTDSNHHDITINGYVKKVRFKYWQALLTNKKFIGRLTSKLQGEYSDRISSFSEYEFSEFNIYNLATEMNTKIRSGIEAEIDGMYDKLTEEHSYYPECTKNKHLYNGWKTNKAWKIDKKCILPVYGIFDSWDGKPRTYEAYKALSDIERILNFFDGNMTADVNLSQVLERHFSAGITKNIPCKFFKLTFYKKGTVHIAFTCPELISRYNIHMGMQRKWLPPCYGTKGYAQMEENEKAVVDSFQGEAEYEKVMARSDYYLRSPIADTAPLLIDTEQQ